MTAPIVAQYILLKDIRHVATRFVESSGGGQDIIMDEFASFTSIQPYLGEPPKNVIDAITEWIANCEIRSED